MDENGLEPALPWMKLAPPHAWTPKQIDEMESGQAYDIGSCVVTFYREKQVPKGDQSKFSISYGGNLHVVTKEFLKAQGWVV